MFSKNAYGECLRSFARIGVGKELEGGDSEGWNPGKRGQESYGKWERWDSQGGRKQDSKINRKKYTTLSPPPLYCSNSIQTSL